MGRPTDWPLLPLSSALLVLLALPGPNAHAVTAGAIYAPMRASLSFIPSHDPQPPRIPAGDPLARYMPQINALAVHLQAGCGGQAPGAGRGYAASEGMDSAEGLTTALNQEYHTNNVALQTTPEQVRQGLEAEQAKNVQTLQAKAQGVAHLTLRLLYSFDHGKTSWTAVQQALQASSAAHEQARSLANRSPSSDEIQKVVQERQSQARVNLALISRMQKFVDFASTRTTACSDTALRSTEMKSAGESGAVDPGAGGTIR